LKSLWLEEIIINDFQRDKIKFNGSKKLSKRPKKTFMGSNYHARAQLLSRCMGSGIIARDYSRHAPKPGMLPNTLSGGPAP